MIKTIFAFVGSRKIRMLSVMMIGAEGFSIMITFKGNSFTRVVGSFEKRVCLFVGRYREPTE